MFVDLGVVVVLHAANKDSLIDSDLNQMASEVTAALFQTQEPVLGLSFVEDLTEGPTEEPEADSLGEITTATWIVRYERNRFDPTT